MWFTIRPASISLASAFLSPAERLERSTSRGAGAKRAAIWLSSSALGNEVPAEAGAGVFWAVAMMVDTSRKVRSRRMGVRVPREKDNSFWNEEGGDGTCGTAAPAVRDLSLYPVCFAADR